MKTKVAASAAAALLAVALAAPAAAAPPSYGSNGVFGVGNNPQAEGWATAFMVPGRYRADQAPSMAPYQSAPGVWYRCHNFPCGPGFPGNVIASGGAIRDVPTFVDVLPTDAGVVLNNVTFTVAN